MANRSQETEVFGVCVWTAVGEPVVAFFLPSLGAAAPPPAPPLRVSLARVGGVVAAARTLGRSASQYLVLRPSPTDTEPTALLALELRLNDAWTVGVLRLVAAEAAAQQQPAVGGASSPRWARVAACVASRVLAADASFTRMLAALNADAADAGRSENFDTKRILADSELSAPTADFLTTAPALQARVDAVLVARLISATRFVREAWGWSTVGCVAGGDAVPAVNGGIGAEFATVRLANNGGGGATWSRVAATEQLSAAVQSFVACAAPGAVATILSSLDANATRTTLASPHEASRGAALVVGADIGGVPFGVLFWIGLPVDEAASVGGVSDFFAVAWAFLLAGAESGGRLAPPLMVAPGASPLLLTKEEECRRVLLEVDGPARRLVAQLNAM